ncbi:hypothetical protein FAF44_05955 [Nonomuraea sp. MG754425]|uniref:hypothetical protein n=1 Tax=Nonomuraea sp. MG754425 TaxID=2570319 RepID=UPI001F1EC2B1|nr:hypothetical protein [Nonomuraea sp. MG754425]MCF6467948.1 hypothetical protein [Nonomuraea sp. MG754425]
MTTDQQEGGDDGGADDTVTEQQVGRHRQGDQAEQDGTAVQPPDHDGNQQRAEGGDQTGDGEHQPRCS